MSILYQNAIAQNAPFAHFIFDLRSSLFTYINPAFVALFDIDIADLSIEKLLQELHDEDLEYLSKTFQEVKSGSIKKDLEFRINTNGQEKWINLTAIPAKNNSEEIIIGYATDITSETNNLDAIKKYANKKNSILNILAHDLRGPLGIANTLTQALAKNIRDQHLTTQLKTISKILTQSVDMITNLIGREFLETIDVELVKKRINVTQKIKEYIEEYYITTEVPKKTFRFTASDDSIFLNLDESKFMQILNNLISNSLKFTTDDGIISLHIQEQPESVLLSVADNGIGIPRQFHATLFQKFSDARRTGLHGEPSIGLGLSIIKTIVEWHNGKIWFESKEGEGTIFYIDFPKQ